MYTSGGGGVWPCFVYCRHDLIMYMYMYVHRCEVKTT